MKKIPAELIEQYKERKINRAEIVERTGCVYDSLKNIFKIKGIELWDKKRKKNKKKVYVSKNFSWKEFKNHYFFNYNK